MDSSANPRADWRWNDARRGIAERAVCGPHREGRATRGPNALASAPSWSVLSVRRASLSLHEPVLIPEEAFRCGRTRVAPLKCAGRYVLQVVVGVLLPHHVWRSKRQLGKVRPDVN